LAASEYDRRRPRIPKHLGERIDDLRGLITFQRWVQANLEVAVRLAEENREREMYEKEVRA
jgi:hypothetical protein